MTITTTEQEQLTRVLGDVRAKLDEAESIMRAMLDRHDPGAEVKAVDHKRPTGIPPETNDDYEGVVDHDSASSFPASDPPAHW